MGKDKSDYFKGFESIKSDYEYLYEFGDEERFRYWIEQMRSKLIADLEAVFKVKRFTDSRISQISTIIWEFQAEKESDFRSAFLNKEIEHGAKLDYPDELYKTVNSHLASGSDEEALVASLDEGLTLAAGRTLRVTLVYTTHTRNAEGQHAGV
jgi:hypothetical protein